MDFNTVFYLLFCLALPLGLTAGITPLVIRWYRQRHWDKPHHGQRQRWKNTHQQTVPRGGGLAIYLGLFLAALVLLRWDNQVIAIVSGALLLTITGVLDDILDLSPTIRLVVNFIVAFMIVSAGISINYVTNPFDTGVIDLQHIAWLPTMLTVFYIVALTNITNWAKGIDGQMPGVVVIAATFIGLLALRLTTHVNQTTILSLMTAGAFAGFLLWNFYPQKIMPGYGGGALAGFLLAVLSITAGAKIATLSMVLALPIADATFTILRRLIAGKSVFLGDRGHLHHKLLDDLGWGRRRIAVFYWLVTLVMGILALILPTWGKIAVFLLVVALVFYFLIKVKLSHLQKIDKVAS